MNVKYSEIFASFQGEGVFVGMPSLWLRFFGCNLECNGFGQKHPTKPASWVLPYKTINIENITKLEELPVFQYGCDSSYSWSKKYDHLVHTATVSEVVDEIIRVGVESFKLEEGESFWYHPKTNQPIQLCLTGGEPLLWQRQIVGLLDEFEERGILPPQITIETNGTRKITYPHILKTESNLLLSVSPKLYSVSGEKDAVKLEVIKDYFNQADGWLKFVVNGTQECWDELDSVLEKLLPDLPEDWTIWVMPVGACKDQQESDIIAEIAEEAMRRGLYVAPRVHTYVFGNKIGK